MQPTSETAMRMPMNNASKRCKNTEKGGVRPGWEGGCSALLRGLKRLQPKERKDKDDYFVASTFHFFSHVFGYLCWDSTKNQNYFFKL